MINFDPRLPKVNEIVQKHWRSSKVFDPFFAQVFPKSPIIAYKKPKNLIELLIRAKIPDQIKVNKREIKGMKKCSKFCSMCPFVKEAKEISNANFTWQIRQKYNCESENVVYFIECRKDNCKEIYIGETKRKIRLRHSKHRNYISNNEQATCIHFNLPGHSASDMQILILEQIRKKDDFYRKERESWFIKKFQTHITGMNRKS